MDRDEYRLQRLDRWMPIVNTLVAAGCGVLLIGAVGGVVAWWLYIARGHRTVVDFSVQVSFAVGVAGLAAGSAATRLVMRNQVQRLRVRTTEIEKENVDLRAERDALSQELGKLPGLSAPGGGEKP